MECGSLLPPFGPCFKLGEGGSKLPLSWQQSKEQVRAFLPFIGLAKGGPRLPLSWQQPVDKEQTSVECGSLLPPFGPCFELGEGGSKLPHPRESPRESPRKQVCAVPSRDCF
jgi:hypothetical protein